MENELDLTFCKDAIELWLRKHPKQNDTLSLHNSIEITLHSYLPHIDHACLAGGGGLIHFDYRRMSSNLEKKAKKYNELIESKGLPYVICIYMDFHSWFREDDLFETLYGGSIHDITHDTKYCDLSKVLYNTSLKNVSGVLMMQGDNFYYYHNFCLTNKLHTVNSEKLNVWQVFAADT